MIRIFFSIIVLGHGLIHLLGFAKAYNYGNVTQLTKDISKPMGGLWLMAALLLVAVAALFLFKNERWWMLGLVAALVSQALILTVWQDAKFGTIVNVLVFVVALLGFTNWGFENRFNEDVRESVNRTKSTDNPILTETDLAHLPPLVQTYLRYVGVVNKPKVKNFKLTFDGEMREKDKDFFQFTSVQYNFFDEPTRLFFMKAQMFGVTVLGYHAYKNGQAAMEIKLFGVYPIVDLKGQTLNKAETVTVFNDMCLMAPASLIDARITWETLDSYSVKATFTNHNIAIQATLFFNDLGQLTNFVSDDRTALPEMKSYRFSTPVKDYRNINGYNIMTYGETIWDYPDGAFVYGKFHLKDVVYNASE